MGYLRCSIVCKDHTVFIISPSVEAENGGTTVLGKKVNTLQSDVEVNDFNITGSLKYVTGYTGFSGDPELQSGHYLAIKFGADDWSDYTSVKVGLDPSATGMDLVELINDPDKNGVFRITDKYHQTLKIVYTDGTTTSTKSYSLRDLVLE